MRHRFLAAVAMLVTATACAVPSGQKADAKPSVTDTATATQEAPTPGSSPSPSPAPPAPETTPPPSPNPITPELTAVAIDDWRYGYAWRGFSKDVNGDGGQYDKPGEVHVTLTVQMTATDDRRPEIPSPNSLWVGHNYGFNFFVKPSRFPDCLPLEGVGLCELSAGSFYSGCEELQNDGDGTNFPSRGTLIMSCRLDATFPETVKASDFKVGVRYDECCDTDTKHRTWLPFQNLPQPPRATEETEETEMPEEESAEPETVRTPPAIRYL
ncbi:hypothetical protein [Streptomyces stackebrandtii]|uniref:hypothetical protein n=1 Tax=Streptomyces stackebrandtii TaxID=3051177 RepID=UPI0028DB3589|nr:hypothetical protein [Streptomyces sp. DSM 40976]